MTIRDATKADIPAILKLESASAGAAHWPRDAYECLFVSDGPQRLALVAVQAEVSGFLVGLRAGPEWELENIAVAEAVRRGGLGSRLIECFLERARQAGATAVWLEVRESNQAARSFYEKFGFRESGRRKGYYVEPKEDAVLYQFDFGTGEVTRNT